jgi:hypothetical protein
MPGKFQKFFNSFNSSSDNSITNTNTIMSILHSAQRFTPLSFRHSVQNLTFACQFGSIGRYGAIVEPGCIIIK